MSVPTFKSIRYAELRIQWVRFSRNFDWDTYDRAKKLQALKWGNRNTDKFRHYYQYVKIVGEGWWVLLFRIKVIFIWMRENYTLIIFPRKIYK